MFAKSLAFAGLASVASAHMIMSNPVPYGKSSLDNSPLLADGSDFPCKQRSGVYSAEGASNVYAQGSTQQLSFIGSAVHGGGSCQVSVTTDLEPTANSVWKVIKSIEGGCPAKNQVGNMGDNAAEVDPYKYDFTIPSDLAEGNYTLAWTWFNKVGNREMYMNCAPLTVTGSSSSKRSMDSFPDMFVANVGSGCGTKADTDLLFPNPGSDVDKFNGKTTAFAAPTGSCSTATAGVAAGTSAAAATTAAATPAASSGGVAGGVFVTVSQAATSAPAATQAATTAAAVTPAPVASTPVASTPAATPSSGSSSGGSSSAFSEGTACTEEGEWNCIGGDSFQRCASGMWSAVIELSSGVSCTPGESSDFAISKRGRNVMRRVSRIRE